MNSLDDTKTQMLCPSLCFQAPSMQISRVIQPRFSNVPENWWEGTSVFRLHVEMWMLSRMTFLTSDLRPFTRMDILLLTQTQPKCITVQSPLYMLALLLMQASSAAGWVYPASQFYLT